MQKLNELKSTYENLQRRIQEEQQRISQLEQQKQYLLQLKQQKETTPTYPEVITPTIPTEKKPTEEITIPRYVAFEPSTTTEEYPTTTPEFPLISYKPKEEVPAEEMPPTIMPRIPEEKKEKKGFLEENMGLIMVVVILGLLFLAGRRGEQRPVERQEYAEAEYMPEEYTETYR